MSDSKQTQQTPSQRSLKGGPAAPQPFAAWIGSFMVLEAMHLITHLASPQTIGRIIQIDFFAAEITYHRILRLPHCPACGYGKRRTVNLAGV